MNTAFWNGEPDAQFRSNANTRFNLRVNQSLPFLRFSNADWEALVDIRNMFREVDVESSVYDEAFAIRAPNASSAACSLGSIRSFLYTRIQICGFFCPMGWISPDQRPISL
jgi:hypothetical protein